MEGRRGAVWKVEEGQYGRCIGAVWKVEVGSMEGRRGQYEVEEGQYGR